MSVLNPTRPELLVDGQGRPYFLWDVDMTLEAFVAELASSDPQVRGYALGKAMRQAKPDDVLMLASPAQIARDWPWAEPYLGQTRDFWTWLLATWRRLGVV
jgi:hypothetical protein